MKAVVILLSIIAFVACLLIGMQAGTVSRNSSGPTQAPGLSPNQSSEQRTLLLIFVDDTQSSSARLAGLWTVFYRPDTPHLMVIPLYPVDASDDLAKQFSLTSEHTPSPTFLQTIQNYHFKWDGYVLVDRTGAAALVDDIQGIAIKGKTLDGKAAVKTLKMPWDKRKDALSSEKAFGDSLCKRIAGQSSNLNVKDLIANLPAQHIRIEYNLDQLSQDWKGLTAQQSQLQCEFSTP